MAAADQKRTDRLVHHAEILAIKGDSFRRKEAQEAAAAKSKKS